MAGLADSSAAASARFSLRRLAPLLVLLAGLAAALWSGAGDYLTPAALQAWSADLKSAATHPAGPAVFVLVYAGAAAISLPGAAFLTLAGGYIFGAWLGTLWSAIGATAGATLLFLAARSGLGEPLRGRCGPWIARLEAGFRRQAASYLLLLRLVPLVPFFIVNLVPAFLGVKLATFVWTTALGILPGGFAYSYVGAQFETIVARGEALTLASVLSAELIAGLAGLAAFAALPIAWRWWRLRHGPGLPDAAP
ncbi:MAG: TVP38/TMEM64 family protein [Alphaproteobacteria bacterium]|nr:TVP38/TMEM64 family protein [Alphaproteobacteria bacterium]